MCGFAATAILIGVVFIIYVIASIFYEVWLDWRRPLW
jgi:hypothetical protein